MECQSSNLANFDYNSTQVWLQVREKSRKTSMNIPEPMVQIWRFEFFFPRNMANWEGLFFKKILCTSRSALLYFATKKKESFSLEQVLSSIIVYILTLFSRRGRTRLVNSQEYASRRILKEKRAQKTTREFCR